MIDPRYGLMGREEMGRGGSGAARGHDRAGQGRAERESRAARGKEEEERLEELNWRVLNGRRNRETGVVVVTRPKR